MFFILRVSGGALSIDARRHIWLTVDDIWRFYNNTFFFKTVYFGQIEQHILEYQSVYRYKTEIYRTTKKSWCMYKFWALLPWKCKQKKIFQKKYLMFQACKKVFVCKNNISIKNTLIWIDENFPWQRLLW